MRILFISSWNSTKEAPHNGIFIRRQYNALINYIDENGLDIEVDFIKGNILRLGEKYDLIHLNVILPGGIPTYILNKLQKTPYIISEHSSPFYFQVKNYFRKFLVKKLITNASYIIAPSNLLLNQIREFGDFKGEVIYNVVNPTLWQLNINSNKRFVYYAKGNINQKRWNWIDEYNVNHYFPSFRVDKYFPSYELSNIISNSCFFVNSSEHESFCCVLAEAMMSGLPSVITLTSGIEYFKEYCGIAVNPYNKNAFFKAIKEMSETFQSYDSIKIREYALSIFRPEVIATQIINIYNKVV